MRKHLRGPIAALTIPVLVALMLVVGLPQRAEAAVVFYGISESSATFHAGPTEYTFHWRFSVARDTSNNQVRYRAHLWCTRNGASTRCNFRNENAYLFFKDCAPSDTSLACERTIDAYGPRNFSGCPTNCNVTGVFHDGTWHPDAHVSYRSYSGYLQARFLDINHLTQVYQGCSKWADPIAGTEYPPSTCF